jgi:hypothetical protein
MNADERFGQLESRVASLELALENERRERAALPSLLLPKTVEASNVIAELRQTLEWNMKAVDERRSELASSRPDDALVAAMVRFTANNRRSR